MDDSVPFMKELASSDRKIRDSALSKFRVYLTSGRSFTPTELRKAWSGFFVAMWHQDRPQPQAQLAAEFADLALALPDDLFLPFMSAFWETMARRWTDIDSLRMDKFLRLVRVMLNAGLQWCRKGKWEESRVKGWTGVVGEWPLSVPGEGHGEGGQLMGNGLRYHVLDVYVDELERVDGEERKSPVGLILQPVRNLMKKGNTKVLRDHARECAEDERLEGWAEGGERDGAIGADDADEDFEGFDAD